MESSYQRIISQTITCTTSFVLRLIMVIKFQSLTPKINCNLHHFSKFKQYSSFQKQNLISYFVTKIF